jgi:stage II sporulation protein D
MLVRVQVSSVRGVDLVPASFEANSALRLVVHDGGLRVEDRARGLELFRLPVGDTLVLAPGDPRSPSMRWRDKTWRGGFRAFVTPQGAITLVSELPLETYLLGVVPGEIGALSDALLEAGRAQAIAARSYTLFYLGRRAELGFDLYGTVEDQVYGPVESERPLASKVVTATAGSAALSRDRPVRANYGSTCGGITAEVWEAWPVAPLNYLVSHRDRLGATDECTASPHYRWSETWSAAEFVANVEKYAPLQGVTLPASGLGALVDVAVLERSRSGRVWRLRVTGSRGEVILHAHAIRAILRRGGNAGAILRSTLFKIGVRRDALEGRAATVVASGAGNGHGVGLCQTGALGLARAGRSGEEIVRHYYPNSELRKLY